MDQSGNTETVGKAQHFGYALAATFSEEEEGILGRVSAENIHVKWTVPPTLSRFSIADNTTLWAPKGCADAYKAAKGWNHAKEIKEE
jgi:hypothetical protein